MQNIKEIWAKALDLLQPEVTSISYNTWFLPIVPLDFSGGVFTVAVENTFAKNAIDGMYNSLVCNCLSQVIGSPVTLNTIYSNQMEDFIPTHSGTNAEPEKKNLNAVGLNPKYTFDNFVVGSANRFAHAASLAVAESPAQAYNPLFLYGSSGLGKTHLLHAIGNYISVLNPSLKIMYISSEKFMNDLITSIQENKNEQFRNKYREIDVLLIDDIQFIAGKHTTEEEFFHTFNHLYQADKQIILSSDHPPKEMHTLEERLRSRFEWGLICDIQAPDYETRLAILQKKMQSISVRIPYDVLEYIAQNVDSNIRELEGALNRITAFTAFEREDVHLDLAKRILAEYSGHTQRTYTVSQIKQCVSDYFDIFPEDLMSQKRTKEIAYARQLCMYIFRTLLDLSYPRIGQEFGRDHTTAMHAINKIEADLKTDISVKNDLNDILKTLDN